MDYFDKYLEKKELKKIKKQKLKQNIEEFIGIAVVVVPWAIIYILAFCLYTE